MNTLFNHAIRLKNIADLGLLYAVNEYDRERYSELNRISLDLLAGMGGYSPEELTAVFPLVHDYPTPKVDVRGLILSDENKILLVKETTDGKWSLPGGWADIGFSPKEMVIKECREETGLEVEVKSLLAVFDKRMHAHPPESHYCYKFVFYCKALTLQIQSGFDIEQVGWFPIDQLPPLSEKRILASQIRLVFEKIMKDDLECCYD